MGFETIGPNAATANGHTTDQKLKKQQKDYEKLKKSKAERRKKVRALSIACSLFRFIVESRKKARSKVRRLTGKDPKGVGRYKEFIATTYYSSC